MTKKNLKFRCGNDDSFNHHNVDAHCVKAGFDVLSDDDRKDNFNHGNHGNHGKNNFNNHGKNHGKFDHGRHGKFDHGHHGHHDHHGCQGVEFCGSPWDQFVFNFPIWREDQYIPLSSSSFSATRALILCGCLGQC